MQARGPDAESRPQVRGDVGDPGEGFLEVSE
jgi:hypothetical protein